MIAKLVSSDKIKKQAKQEGMKTMFDQCLNLVRQGITTIEEIISLLYSVN